jgi:hypothetical protein
MKDHNSEQDDPKIVPLGFGGDGVGDVSAFIFPEYRSIASGLHDTLCLAFRF